MIYLVAIIRKPTRDREFKPWFRPLETHLSPRRIKRSQYPLAKLREACHKLWDDRAVGCAELQENHTVNLKLCVSRRVLCHLCRGIENLPTSLRSPSSTWIWSILPSHGMVRLKPWSLGIFDFVGTFPCVSFAVVKSRWFTTTVLWSLYVEIYPQKVYMRMFEGWMSSTLARGAIVRIDLNLVG